MNDNYYLSGQDFIINSSTDSWNGSYTYCPTETINAGISLGQNDNGKISPQLYFKYIKKKFGTLERIRLDRRIKKIEGAFDECVDSGQNVLAEKILTDLAREIRESVIVAKGVSEYIERSDLDKYKHQIKEGHISDTLLKGYTRVIPKSITSKIKKLKGVFDDFVIWHYYEEEVEKKREKKQKLTPREVDDMRDPVLFGIIKETDRLYFIADWEDDYCDLTFDEIVDVIGSKRIGKKINIGN